MSITRIHGTAGAPGVFLAPSASVPNMAHQVAYQCEGIAFCSCPSFQHRQECRHVESVAAFVRAEALAIPRTEVSIEAARQREAQIAELFSI